MGPRKSAPAGGATRIDEVNSGEHGVSKGWPTGCRGELSARPPAGYDPLAQPSVYSRTSDPVVDAYPKVLKPPTVTVPELKRTGVGTTATRHPGEWDQARPKHPFTYQLQVGTVAIPGERPPDEQAARACAQLSSASTRCITA